MSTHKPRHPHTHSRILSLTMALAAVVVMIFTSGCSVFGIATKSDLEAVDQAANERRNQVVREVMTQQERLDAVAEDVSALEQSLEPRMAALEDSVDGTREEVRVLEAIVEDVRLYTARVDEGMQSVVTAAEHAHVRSRETWDTYFNSLLEERTSLQLRLDALTEKIERLQAQETQRRETQDPPTEIEAAASSG